METLKVLVIGDSAVGKTCLICRYTDNKFLKSFVSTIGIDYKVKQLEVEGVGPVKLELWDTAGQERFHSITNSYFRGCHGVLLVFDVTNADSFLSVRTWLETVKRLAPEKARVVVVANKVDLTSRRVIPPEEGRRVALEHGNVPYVETSALTGHCVDATFLQFATTLVHDKRERRKKKIEAGSALDLRTKLSNKVAETSRMCNC